MIRPILAPNASPLTLDGTRTYLVGRRRVAIIDPGPGVSSHLDAVTEEIGDGVVVSILLTHSHPDHAEGAEELAERVSAPLLRAEGMRVSTDTGDLISFATPGHTPDHLAFHLPGAEAVFVGDLMLGGMETALVSTDEGGDLGAYLRSLERVRALRPRILYPAHGPPFTDPGAAIDTYMEHRRERQDQVLAAMGRGARTIDELVAEVYGEGLAPGLIRVARGAIGAYLRYLTRESGTMEREPCNHGS